MPSLGDDLVEAAVNHEAFTSPLRDSVQDCLKHFKDIFLARADISIDHNEFGAQQANRFGDSGILLRSAMNPVDPVE